MLGLHKIRVFALALALVGAGSFVYAQNTADMALMLHSEQGNSVKDELQQTLPSSEFGRFRLMLDNRFAKGPSKPKSEKGNIIAELRIAPPVEGRVLKTGVDFFNPLNESITIKSADGPLNSFPQMVTLNSSYAKNAIGFAEPSADVISGGGQNGRLKFYGSYVQQMLPAVVGSEKKSSARKSSLRGSVISNQSLGQAAHDVADNSTMASNYYVEASYNFMPSFTGKVSFKRFAADTHDSKEELRIEGVVDTGANTQIKAGYNNEASPEVAEPKKSLNTSVWTEFILKF